MIVCVCCSAGVGRTGVFITLSIVLERMRYEGVVDIFQTVKMLRTQRPAMVQTEVCIHTHTHMTEGAEVRKYAPYILGVYLCLCVCVFLLHRNNTSFATVQHWSTWAVSITMQHKVSLVSASFSGPAGHFLPCNLLC